jgi:hypothetical protein
LPSQYDSDEFASGESGESGVEEGSEEDDEDASDDEAGPATKRKGPVRPVAKGKGKAAPLAKKPKKSESCQRLSTSVFKLIMIVLCFNCQKDQEWRSNTRKRRKLCRLSKCKIGSREYDVLVRSLSVSSLFCDYDRTASIHTIVPCYEVRAVSTLSTFECQETVKFEFRFRFSLYLLSYHPCHFITFQPRPRSPLPSFRRAASNSFRSFQCNLQKINLLLIFFGRHLFHSWRTT